MRFQNCKTKTVGTSRIKERFLIFPKTINNETRWLEKAKWKQIYSNVFSSLIEGYYSTYIDYEWID